MRNPYFGEANGRPQECPRTNVAVVGYPGSGKSRRVLGPAILYAGTDEAAPVLAVSSKDDLLELTSAYRASSGECFVLDFTGEARIPDHARLTQVRYDPCIGIATEDEATELAELLIKTSTVGSGGGMSNEGFWSNTVSPLLAALILAASRLYDDGQIASAIDWLTAAAVTIRPDENSDDPLAPSWVTAVGVVGIDSANGIALHARINGDSRMTDNALSTMLSATAPFRRRVVAGDPEMPVFTPEMLDPMPGNAPTLYVISNESGATAGAAAGAVESVLRRWRTQWHAMHGEENLLVVLDEYANTCPIAVDVHMNTLRSARVRIMLGLQSLTQLEKFGASQAKILRDTITAYLILDAIEDDLFETASKYEGETYEETASISTQDTYSRLGRMREDVTGKTYSGQYRRVVQPWDMLTPNIDQALALVGKKLHGTVRIPDFSEVVSNG